MIVKKLLLLVFIFNAIGGFSQSKEFPYKFSKEIHAAINKDTTPWKYQTGAAEMSFSGYYKNVLELWDKNGVRKPKYNREDSLLISEGNMVNARDLIIREAKNVHIIIINEAHHLPQHRVFTRSLLKGLYDNGYRYLGLEALFDTMINQRKFPVIEMGYYTREPDFGNLIAEALDLGFILFPYEASGGKNGKEREIEQAQNIQRFIDKNPKGKVLIHCGFAHAFENDYAPWEKAMAGRLKDLLKTDPLTIDQTNFMEKSTEENTHLFIKRNNTGHPVVLVNKNGEMYKGRGGQTDLVIIHPPTKYIHNRPDWLIRNRIAYQVPADSLLKAQPSLVMAYRNNEYENNGIPADIIEITDQMATGYLYLNKGQYEIVVLDKNYNSVKRYTIKIG